MRLSRSRLPRPRPTAPLLALIAASLLAAGGLGCARPARTSGELDHEAYVWQRAWRPEVVAAVQRVGDADSTALSGVVVLAAEVDLSADRPEVHRVAIGHPTLAALGDAGVRVGLALRVNESPTRFAQRPDLVARLAGLAAGLAAASRSRGVEPAEIQIDHDCPTSRLTDCALLVAAVREAVAPLPTVFTALPTWLDEPRGFERLAESADGFVLQVHGLAIDRDSSPRLTLVDPQAARRAVESAARFRRPFRVALPTFTHLVAVDGAGRVREVVSEDAPARLGRAAGATWRPVASDPEAMAGLVRAWTASRPELLRGVVWYRLPVSGDRLNWTPSVLASVLDGRSPARGLGLRFRRPAPGLVEVDLVNRGDTREPAPRRIVLRWGEGRLLAADGLGGYRFDAAAGELLLAPGAAPFPQAAGERRTVAWLRLDGADGEPEVHGDILR